MNYERFVKGSEAYQDAKKQGKGEAHLKQHGIKSSKSKAIKAKMGKKDRVGSRKKDFTTEGKQGNWMKVHKLDRI